MFDTFFQKKTLYASITGLFLGLILLGCPFFVSASDVPFSDSFNSYILDTPLNGQGSWSEGYNKIYIDDDNCEEGYCAKMTVDIGGSGYTMIKTGTTTITNGSWSWFMYSPSNDFRTFATDIYSTDSQRIISVQTNTGVMSLWGRDSGGNSIQRTIKDLLPLNTWFRITCEWSNLSSGAWTARQVRCRYDDGGSWTDWIIPRDGGTTTGKNISAMYFRLTKTGDQVDVIGNPTGCSYGYCDNCLTSDTCLAENCIWDYNTGYERWECHNVWTAYIAGCGMGFGCYGCADQSTCESATPFGTCEWVDRGYGVDCYPVETPPEEATWEAPELESCDGLGTIETWLCEIRNFFAGLFNPTQEKVDNLRLTIENFKTKFPFNYANSLSAFFTTIKTGLETDKDIPVEMFGHTGNINFDFLDATGTIGGTSETFKNILYDFTTALIVFGFVLWLISFIKRIF